MPWSIADPGRRPAVTSMLAGAVRREPLAATDGRSGSLLERVVLAGGETPVVKHASAASDWIMRATGDGGRVEDNLNPVGRIFYSASTLVCVPNALSQGRPALGSQVPEARLRKLLAQAGFGRMRRAAETPFNRVLEARP
jgi:hypothetical protein